MSLPASLMTDCGGLLNRRSPGRKRCCHTEALHAGYHVYSSHGLFLSRIIELVCFHTESHGESRRVSVLLSRDLSFGPTDQREVICELSNFSSHGMSRMVTVFSHEFSFCPELSNLRIGFLTRKVTEYHGWFLSRDLFFGPTDQREVICELSIFYSHGMSRMVAEVMRVEL